MTDRRGLALEIGAYALLVLVSRWPWAATAGNEMDVLAAARQRADPAWLPVDPYLTLDIPYRLPFEHLLGPVAAAWGMPAAAVVGRLSSYLLVAAALVALLRALRVDRWLALLPVALFLTHQSLVAGEWMVGTAEAKPYAYAAGVAAVAAAVARRPRVCAALLGAAVTAHLLVGLYHLAALVTGALVAHLAGGRSWRVPGPRGMWAICWPGLVTGAWGAWLLVRTLREPQGPDAEAAWRLYTEARVAHHVLPAAWPTGGPLPWWVLLPAAVVGLLILLRRGGPRWRLVAGFGLTAAALFAVGLALAATGRTPLLRYYWFRLGDVWLPLVAALVAAAALTRLLARVERRPRPPVVAGIMLCLTGLLVTPPASERRDRAADRTAAVAASGETGALSWVARHLPRTAVVATDPEQTEWYPTADRAAFVLLKSSPQSAPDIAGWAGRLQLASGRPLRPRMRRGELRTGHRSLSPQDLRALRAAGATHYVAARPDTPPGTTLLHREGEWGVYALRIGPG